MFILQLKILVVAFEYRNMQIPSVLITASTGTSNKHKYKKGKKH